MRMTVARSDESIKEFLVEAHTNAIATLLNLAPGCTASELERVVWELVLPLGRGMLEAGYAVASRELARAELRAQETAMADATFRDDGCYNACVTSTLGSVSFPTFAFRNADGETQNPARETLFPAYRACRSTPLCVELEAYVGKSFAFRSAESALNYVTHGAVAVADNTIARHAVTVGKMIDPTWLYTRPCEIERTLEQKATRDRKTGRPLLYVSTDAHNLRRYLDDTWTAEFKGFNGIRLWCEDARTGSLIHLGGEYTWDRCEDVVKHFQRLHRDGILPRDGRYRTVHAQLVFVSDGAKWLAGRVLPLFDDVVAILDPFHVLEWVAEFAKPLRKLGVGTPVIPGIRRRLGFEARRKRRKTARRRGHKKRALRRSHAHNHANWDFDAPPGKVVDDVIAFIKSLPRPNSAVVKHYCDFIEKLEENKYRMGYDEYRRRGMQIGSGAMESLHRQASQIRLKLPGMRACSETGEALVNLRLLDLVGRWEEFFGQADIERQLATAFGAPTRHAVHPADLAA